MASVLTPISEFSKKSKRRKTKLSSLVSSYETVSTINLQEHGALKEIPSEVKEWWLIDRFGLQCVTKVGQLLQSIPVCLKSSQKKDLLLKLCGLKEEDVQVIAAFISDHNLFHQGGGDGDKDK